MIDSTIRNYMSKLGKKGGKWSDHRRIGIGRLGGLASGQSRRQKAAEKKSKKDS